MKVKIITATAIMAISFAAFQASEPLQSKPDGSPSASTGSPGDNYKTCAQSGCHTGVAVKTKNGLIKSNIPVTGYVPGTTYTITAKVKSASVNRWGFEVSPQNSITGAKMGNLIVTNSTQTKLVGTGKYITHTQAGNSGAGTKTWTFNWQAPAAGSGKVKFYGAFLYANNNGGKSGDTTYKSTLLIYEDTIPQPLAQQPEQPEQNKISSDCTGTVGLSVYPNPFSTSSRIRFATENMENFDYEIYSATGERISKQENASVAEEIEIGNNLAPGIYFIRATQAGHSKTIKIVKTR